MSSFTAMNDYKPWMQGYFIWQVNAIKQTYGGKHIDYKEIYNKIHYKDVEDKIIQIQHLYRQYKWLDNS